MVRTPRFDNRSLFAEMDALFRGFESAFGGLDGRHGLVQLGGTGVLQGPYATEVGWELTADLPGVQPEGLTLTVKGRTLEVRAERKIENDDGKLHREDAPDPRVRQRLLSDLFSVGLGRHGAESGLQEGAAREAEHAEEDELRRRGLDPSACCMTVIRAPEAYATFSAHVKPRHAVRTSSVTTAPWLPGE